MTDDDFDDDDDDSIDESNLVGVTSLETCIAQCHRKTCCFIGI